MGVAAFAVHAKDPWFSGSGDSKEPALIFMFGFLALVFTGAGSMSLDAKLFSGKKGGDSSPKEKPPEEMD